MSPPKLGHFLKEAAKAPRDQLDRCAFLMKLCMEAKKAANSAEDGTKPATMTAADAFVDKACRYVTGLAEIPTIITDLTASAREQEQEWEFVKVATSEVLKVLPPNVSVSMKKDLQKAEASSKEAGSKMKEITKVLGNGSKKSTVKLYFVCGPSGKVRGEDYEIQRCTPPSGLATIVLYRKREGCLPNFYLTYPHPIDSNPANWGPKDPTPAELYVVMDRGRFEFRFKIGHYSPITETWVFRNLFKLRELFYLKDSGGKLHPAPNGDLTFDNVVHCTKIQRSDRKRIAGPYPCTQWGEALKYIGAASDADWIVETENKDEKPQSPSPRYITSRSPITSPSLNAISHHTSRTFSIASAPPILPGPIFASPASSMTSLALSPSPSPHQRSHAKVPSSLLTTASVVRVTIPPTALPPTSLFFSPIVPPTAPPVIQEAVPLTSNSAVLSIFPPMASSAVPLAVPVVSDRPIISPMAPATPSNQPKGGFLGKAVKWTRRTLGM